jgi:hypothetical protein
MEPAVLKETLAVVVFVGVWIFLSWYLLPKLGVPT